MKRPRSIQRPTSTGAARSRQSEARSEQGPMMRELQRRAEAQLKKQKNHQEANSEDPRSARDPRRQFHELQVQQVELEMQNNDLRQARDELELTLENYTELYDFAPVGYFTLAPDSTIQQANLTGASLVGIERSRLVGRGFDQHFATAQRPVFHAFLKKVFAKPTRQSGDFELLRPGQPPVTVNVEARCSPGGESCRVAVVDITARKRAEEGLRVSEVRYRRLFEAAHDGVLILDPATRKITDANPFMTQLLGYSHEQLVGKELFEIGLLQDEAASQEMFRKLKRQHEVRYEDLPLESKTGRHQEVEVVANLYQEDGHSVIQCNVRDITARKITEKELLEKARLLDLSHDAIIVRDMKGHVRYWNHGAEELYGWSRQEAMGKISNVLLKTEYPLPLKRMVTELHRTDRWVGELVHTNRAGRRITVLARKTLDRDSKGCPQAVLENITDFTERKQAEEVLLRSEALFAALVEQAPVGVYVVDGQLRLQQVNPRAQPVFRHVRPLLGRDLSQIMHALWPKKTANEVMARFRHTLKTGEPYQTPEFAEHRRDTGQHEIYEWQIQRVTLPGGEHGVVCFFNNITERKQAEEAQRRMEVLAASNQKLEEEIIRRQAVEKSLQQSERHQRLLLVQSRDMQGQLRHLSHQILSAQEDERRKISRELHDEIAQTLAGINLRLGALKAEAGARGQGFQNKISRTQRLVEKSVEIVHRFARDLRPTLLDDLGLIPALHAFVKIFTKDTGLRVRLTVFAGVEELGSSKRTVLYRVAQEALTNVARHAHATTVDMHIEKLAQTVSMVIKDNGTCPPTDPMRAAKRGKRLGLIGMRERLEMVGGSFDIQCVEGKGTTVHAEIPYGNVRGGGGGNVSDRVRPG
jgi:PAS domain S-box-containing protein